MPRLTPLALCAAILFAPPAQAALTFAFPGEFTSGFTQTGNPLQSTATFGATLPGPITTDELVVPDSCLTTSADWVCRATGQWMNASGTPNGVSPPITTPVAFIGLNLDNTGGGGNTFCHSFEATAFTTPGTYPVWTFVNGDITNGTGFFGNAGTATLTVTQTQSPPPGAVPVPMSLALLATSLRGLAAPRRH